ncbi:hypothetical protein C84B14_00730 [Salinisphaera sp. C84B14]|uniref:DUF58 domain-containing protein n=1 Tax=Salinisphaera sp. C84B14 TaxID=1304155 RepID=UPI00333E95FD
MAALRRHARTLRTRFIERRNPPRSLPLRVSRRRVYILPTRNGVVFAVLLLVMLLGATNYSNSLAFALTFWLAAVALVSMHHAHANLVGLRLQAIHASPVFAGDTLAFELSLEATGGRRRRALRVSADGRGATGQIDIGPGESRMVTIEQVTDARGRCPCPRLRIESIYPVGLFRAWTWLQPNTQVLVYPRCAGHDRLPRGAGDTRSTRQLARRGTDEFLGHRDYVPGDSPRHIDWKASARSDDLRMREYADRQSEAVWLDEDRLGTNDREARLSQLARWVVVAERSGIAYGLQVNAQRLGPDQGPAHRLACLRALALA